MRIATTRAELARPPGRLALVPTMGALHAGHRALIRRAREVADGVAVTIFVNPLQFGAGEDLARYPRPLEADLVACEEEGVDLVFAPPPDVVYPREPRIRVTAGPLGGKLCGASRPGHFDGVLTVVAKLLHLLPPDVAVFGEKDAQQLRLVRAMVADLDFPVEIVGVPTVREPDGLALSSRNAYLSPGERASAGALPAALRAGAAAAGDGPDAVRRAARAVLDAEPGVRLDYLELADPDSLDPLDRPHDAALLAVAAWVGSTRLIDNVTIQVAGTYSKEP